MREIAKSMLGFSWAVSVFGAQQAGRLLQGASGERAREVAGHFDDISRTIQGHLSGMAERRFRAGDDWQRRMVDAVFDMGGRFAQPRDLAASLDPRQLADASPRTIVDASMNALQRSMDGLRNAVDGLTTAATPKAADATAAAPTGPAPAAS